ncbi:putative leader peptide [Actinacidiphila sp. ITFR-21]|nr:putative leader peptide [Streptomyces sp. ITFR-21]WNI14381.1 putative leader peptide [Streptomyces sp. ITFR-21]
MRAVRQRCLRHPAGTFQSRVTRRHVDLLRVNSALCPGIAAPVR